MLGIKDTRYRKFLIRAIVRLMHNCYHNKRVEQLAWPNKTERKKNDWTKNRTNICFLQRIGTRCNPLVGSAFGAVK